MFRFGLILLLSAVAWNAQAQSASASLSETSAQVKYGAVVGGSANGRSVMTMGFLFNENEDYIAELGLGVVDEAGSRAPGLKIGVGGKVYGAARTDKANDINLLALGLGLELMYRLPQVDRLSIGGVAYYAPPIVSFMDAERFRETAVRMQFSLFPDAEAFVEYQQFYVTLDENRGSSSIEKGARVGLQVEF